MQTRRLVLGVHHESSRLEISLLLVGHSSSSEEEDELLLEDGDDKEPPDNATIAGAALGFSALALPVRARLSVLELEARRVSLTMATQAWRSWCVGRQPIQKLAGALLLWVSPPCWQLQQLSCLQ